MAVVMTLLPLTMPAVNAITYTATYSMDNFSTGIDTLGNEAYTTVTYDGLNNSGNPGAPFLPIDIIRFSVPFNSYNFSINSTVSMAFGAVLGKRLIYPCQEPKLMSDTTPVSITLPDSAIYYSNSHYPTQRAWIVDEGFIEGGNHIVTVAVCPWYYKHSLNPRVLDNFMLYRRVNLTLSYDVGSSNITPIYCLNDTVKQRGQELARSMVVNPDDVQGFAADENYIVSIGSMSTGIDDYLSQLETAGITGDPEELSMHLMPGYDYTLITTNSLKPAMKRILALRSQKGMSAGVITMEEIMRNPLVPYGDMCFNSDGSSYVAFDDGAGRLRQFLKIAYGMNKCKYVLLAGSVPSRYITMGPILGKYKTYPSDLYYSDLNGDWKNNKLDLDPELFVGRLIAKNSQQISDFTDKLLRYELNPGKGNTGYLKNAFYSQGYDMRVRGEVSNVRKIGDSVFPCPTVLEESLALNDKSGFPNGKDIVDTINANGYGFISFHHHGYPSSLLVYGFRAGGHMDRYRFLWAIDSVHVGATNYINDDTTSGNGLNNLTNKYNPSVCYSIACRTIPFDTMSGYETIPMNFGESFTTGRNYGGPIFIGNTHDGITPTSSYLEKSFLGQIYQGKHRISEANGLAKSYFYVPNDTTITRYISTVQNLLGDPALEIWTTDEPHQFLNISTIRTDSTITVTGIDVDSAIVAYSYMQTVKHQGTDTIQAGNSAVFRNISPNSTIMVYKDNCIPYIAPLIIQNARINKSQYIIASDVAIGRSVDVNRTNGDVTIKRGVEYEIELSGSCSLMDGFKVEKGAAFAVYPSCF